MTFLGAAL